MKNKLKLKVIGLGTLAGLLQSAALWAQTTAAPAAATPAKPQGFMEQFSFLPMLAIIIGIFYVLIIRPQQKQQKERAALISAVKKGDMIITVGGIHGRVTGVADSLLTIEIADNCKIKLDKTCVQSVNADKEKDKE